jgi:hypothetical protein
MEDQGRHSVSDDIEPIWLPCGTVGGIVFYGYMVPILVGNVPGFLGPFETPAEAREQGFTARYGVVHIPPVS